MSAKDQIKQIVDYFKIEPQLKHKTDGMAEGLMLGASLADEANELSKDVQAQVDQLVIEGDSSVEAAQARVDADGKSYVTLKKRLDEKEKEFTAEFAQINTKLQFVSYDDFGANRDKKYYNNADGLYYLDTGFASLYDHDDGIEIEKAHAYANEHNIPIRNLSGEYVIKNHRNIVVQSSTDLGLSVFHLDESNATINEIENLTGEVFKVTSKKEPIVLGSSYHSTLLPKMKKGTPSINELSFFRDSLVIVEDENKRVGIRQGENSDSGKPMTDWFYIGNGGKIIGDLTWNFVGITKVTIYPCDKDFLEIRGGVFKLNGRLNTDSGAVGYEKTGFSIERSRVMVNGQSIGFETGVTDSATNLSDGFYNFKNGYKVRLSNVDVPPRKNVMVNQIKQGTYGIVAEFMVDFVFDSVTSVGSSDVWGSVGTNFIKNWVIRNSDLNRIDNHFYVWNLTIENCRIGIEGITLTGGGLLHVIDTTVENIDFIQFRGDYGSRWDGDIIIDNGRLIVDAPDREAQILRMDPLAGNYGYEIIFANRIIIDNFTFDYVKYPLNNLAAKLFRFTELAEISNAPVYFPRVIDVKNVDVKGRNTGVELLDINKPNLRRIGKTAKFKLAPADMDIETNALYHFKNVYTTEIPGSAKSSHKHIYLEALESDVYVSNSLVPEIKIENSSNLSLGTLSSIAKLNVIDSSINHVDGYSGGKGRSRVDLTNCDIKPNIVLDGNPAMSFVDNEVHYNSCKFYPIRLNGNIDMLQTMLGQLGIFVENNTQVRLGTGYHTGSILSRDLVLFLRTNTKFATKMETLFKELRLSTRNYEYTDSYTIL